MIHTVELPSDQLTEYTPIKSPHENVQSRSIQYLVCV